MSGYLCDGSMARTRFLPMQLWVPPRRFGKTHTRSSSNPSSKPNSHERRPEGPARALLCVAESHSRIRPGRASAILNVRTLPPNVPLRELVSEAKALYLPFEAWGNLDLVRDSSVKQSHLNQILPCLRPLSPHFRAVKSLLISTDVSRSASRKWNLKKF